MELRQKIRNLKDCCDNTSIYDAYYTSQIDEKLVYFESRNGRDFTGNLFRIIEELSTGKYGEFKIHVYAEENVKSKILDLKRNYNLKIDEIITSQKLAGVTLEKAKYIFTDSGIQHKYVKKPGQIFVNTWHGTPLKLMGCDNISEITSLGHIQHSLLSSDYLIYPNEYMCEKMMKAYMIEKIYPGNILFEGYPRNSIFFNRPHAIELKRKLDIEDKEVFIYMPTFRGVLGDMDNVKQKSEVEQYFSSLDTKLNDNQILFAKLHVYNESKIDFSKFSHIKPFPKDYEIYEVVNMGDVLITDYSSVFFDFANTARKIIIFNYDEEDYMSYRGFYFPLEELPFPKVQNVDDLVRELNSPKDYDDAEFIRKFATYDNPDASKNLCMQIFKNSEISRQMKIENKNPNYLIFAGDLKDSTLTRNLIEMLEKADRTKNNFFITFNPWDKNIKENYSEIFSKFPEGVEFLPFRYNLIPTFKEKLDYNRYFNEHASSTYPDSLNALFKRSFDKQYGMVDFDFVLDYSGENPDVSLILANSSEDSMIWIHEDFFKNQDIKSHIKSQILNSFDAVIADSDEVADEVFEITRKRENIFVYR